MSLSIAPCQTCGCQVGSCEPCTASEGCSNCGAGCCCPPEHSAWRMHRISRAVLIEYLGSLWMVVEVVGAIGVGILSGSLALLAFGGDSVVELLSSFAVIRHLRGDATGSRALGHRAAEVATLLLFAIIPTIGAGAAYSYFTGLRPDGSPLGVLIAVGAVAFMPYLWLEKRKIGRETNCLPLSIDAVESATCFLMSIALLAGLAVEYLFGFWLADYIATAVILAFVAREATEAYREMKVES